MTDPLFPAQQLLRAAFIFVVMGSLFFVIGEMLPRSRFNYTAFPFRTFHWERGGRIYRRIGIHRWKSRLPDMSRYIKTMFAKRLYCARNPEYTRRLILETCVAELIHSALMLLSFIFIHQLSGLYGEIAALLYALGNLPFVLIQRYNRPRLIMLLEKQLSLRQRQQNSRSGG